MYFCIWSNLYTHTHINVDWILGWLANNNSEWLAAFSSLSALIKFNYLMAVEVDRE